MEEFRIDAVIGVPVRQIVGKGAHKLRNGVGRDLSAVEAHVADPPDVLRGESIFRPAAEIQHHRKIQIIVQRPGDLLHGIALGGDGGRQKGALGNDRRDLSRQGVQLPQRGQQRLGAHAHVHRVAGFLRLHPIAGVGDLHPGVLGVDPGGLAVEVVVEAPCDLLALNGGQRGGMIDVLCRQQPVEHACVLHLLGKDPLRRPGQHFTVIENRQGHLGDHGPGAVSQGQLCAPGCLVQDAGGLPGCQAGAVHPHDLRAGEIPLLIAQDIVSRGAHQEQQRQQRQYPQILAQRCLLLGLVRHTFSPPA